MATVQSVEIPEFKIIFAKTKSVHGTRKELITVYTIIGLESGSTIVKNVRASDAQHIETYGADIAKEGYIGWRKKRVIGVGTVKTGCHESNAQLGVGAVVWAANDTEVEFLLLFILVGIIEVVQESRQKRLFLGQSILLCGGFVHPRRVCLHIARRNGDITEFGLACFYG